MHWQVGMPCRHGSMRNSEGTRAPLRLRLRGTQPGVVVAACMRPAASGLKDSAPACLAAAGCRPNMLLCAGLFFGDSGGRGTPRLPPGTGAAALLGDALGTLPARALSAASPAGSLLQRAGEPVLPWPAGCGAVPGLPAAAARPGRGCMHAARPGAAWRRARQLWLLLCSALASGGGAAGSLGLLTYGRRPLHVFNHACHEHV